MCLRMGDYAYAAGTTVFYCILTNQRRPVLPASEAPTGDSRGHSPLSRIDQVDDTGGRAIGRARAAKKKESRATSRSAVRALANCPLIFRSTYL